MTSVERLDDPKEEVVKPISYGPRKALFRALMIRTLLGKEGGGYYDKEGGATGLLFADTVGPWIESEAQLQSGRTALALMHDEGVIERDLTDGGRVSGARRTYSIKLTATPSPEAVEQLNRIKVLVDSGNMDDAIALAEELVPLPEVDATDTAAPEEPAVTTPTTPRPGKVAVQQAMMTLLHEELMRADGLLVRLFATTKKGHGKDLDLESTLRGGRINYPALVCELLHEMSIVTAMNGLLSHNRSVGKNQVTMTTAFQMRFDVPGESEREETLRDIESLRAAAVEQVIGETRTSIPAPRLQGDTDALPLPPTDELHRIVNSALNAVRDKMPRDENVHKVTLAMNRFLQELGYDPDVVLFFLKELGFVRCLQTKPPVWYVKRGGEVSLEAISKMLEQGRRPRRYRPFNTEVPPPGEGRRERAFGVDEAGRRYPDTVPDRLASAAEVKQVSEPPAATPGVPSRDYGLAIAAQMRERTDRELAEMAEIVSRLTNELEAEQGRLRKAEEHLGHARSELGRLQVQVQIQDEALREARRDGIDAPMLRKRVTELAERIADLEAQIEEQPALLARSAEAERERDEAVASRQSIEALLDMATSPVNGDNSVQQALDRAKRVLPEPAPQPGGS